MWGGWIVNPWCVERNCNRSLDFWLFFSPPFYFMYTLFLFFSFFFARWGGRHVWIVFFFFFFLCTASTLYSDKTPLCSLMETQCWTQNTDRVSLVEANVAVKLPRKPWNVFTSYVAVRITGCFYGRLWTPCGRFKADSYLGGHLYHLWSRLALLCLITIRKVKSPRPCFRKETAKKKKKRKKPWRSKLYYKSTLFLLILLWFSSSCNSILCNLRFDVQIFTLLRTRWTTQRREGGGSFERM